MAQARKNGRASGRLLRAFFDLGGTGVCGRAGTGNQHLVPKADPRLT